MLTTCRIGQTGVDFCAACEAALFTNWRLHGSLPADRGGSASADEPVDKIDTTGRQVARWLGYVGAGPLWLKTFRLADLIVSSLRYGKPSFELYVLRARVVMCGIVPNCEGGLSLPGGGLAVGRNDPGGALEAHPTLKRDAHSSLLVSRTL